MVTLKPVPKSYWIEMEAVAAFDRMLTDMWPERQARLGLGLLYDWMIAEGRTEDAKKLATSDLWRNPTRPT